MSRKQRTDYNGPLQDETGQELNSDAEKGQHLSQDNFNRLTKKLGKPNKQR